MKVAALVPRYAPTGEFTHTTRPTLAQVENWIDEISSVVNVVLSELYFVVPVTQADCVLMLAGLVCSAAADKCEYANRSGRFWTETAVDRGISIEKVLRNEITEWLYSHAQGLKNMGAERTGEADELSAAGTFSYTPTRSDGYHDAATGSEYESES